jgi:DNA-binding transcriptional LysR family regulator
MNEKIELRHLRYFVAVAQELNFGRAAKRLKITQPSLSRQIQKLEQELAVKLFERLPSQIQLTRTGELFLVEAQQILAKVEQGIKIIQRANRGEIGQLKIGFQGSAVYDLIPNSIRAFRSSFPNVDVIIQLMGTKEQISALENNQLDLGFVVPPIDNSKLIVETILQEPVIVVLPENHPLAHKTEITIADLGDEPLILASRDRGCGLFEQIFNLYYQADLRPNIIYAAREMQVMLGFVAAGMGISLLPAYVQSLQRLGVVYRSLKPHAPVVELAIAYQNNNYQPTLQAFLAIVKQQSFLS